MGDVMKRSHFFILAMFFSAVILSQGALAANDPNAAVVQLRTSCLACLPIKEME